MTKDTQDAFEALYRASDYASIRLRVNDEGNHLLAILFSDGDMAEVHIPDQTVGERVLYALMETA